MPRARPNFTISSVTGSGWRKSIGVMYRPSRTKYAVRKISSAGGTGMVTFCRISCFSRARSLLHPRLSTFVFMSGWSERFSRQAECRSRELVDTRQPPLPCGSPVVRRGASHLDIYEMHKVEERLRVGVNCEFPHEVDMDHRRLHSWGLKSYTWRCEKSPIGDSTKTSVVTLLNVKISTPYLSVLRAVGERCFFFCSISSFSFFVLTTWPFRPDSGSARMRSNGLCAPNFSGTVTCVTSTRPEAVSTESRLILSSARAGIP